VLAEIIEWLEGRTEMAAKGEVGWTELFHQAIPKKVMQTIGSMADNLGEGVCSASPEGGRRLVGADATPKGSRFKPV
jgi:hypothetical protein